MSTFDRMKMRLGITERKDHFHPLDQRCHFCRFVVSLALPNRMNELKEYHFKSREEIEKEKLIEQFNILLLPFGLNIDH